MQILTYAACSAARLQASDLGFGPGDDSETLQVQENAASDDDSDDNDSDSDEEHEEVEEEEQKQEQRPVAKMVTLQRGAAFKTLGEVRVEQA